MSTTSDSQDIYANATVLNSYNEKINDERYPFFIVNGFVIILLNVIAWILSGLFYLLSSRNPSHKILASL